MYARLFPCRVALKNNTNLVSAVNLQEFLLSGSSGCQVFLG